MTRACLRTRRALSVLAASGRPIPDGSSLSRHLSRCPGCRLEREWYYAAERDLRNALPAPNPSEALAGAAWARLSATRSHRQPAAWPAVLAAAMVCSLAALIRHPSAQTPVIRPEARIAAAKASAVSIERRPEKSNRTLPILVAARPDPPRVRHIRRHRPLRLARVHRKLRPDTDGMARTAEPTPLSLAGLACWYEASGDYQSAAAAYGRAADEQPTETLLFNAGRTSECAGEVGQAVDFYARMLSRGCTQTPPSKQDDDNKRGTEPWNEPSV